jgi:hypothetical protein
MALALACLVPLSMGVRQGERAHCDRSPDGGVECMEVSRCEYDDKTHRAGTDGRGDEEPRLDLVHYRGTIATWRFLNPR